MPKRIYLLLVAVFVLGLFAIRAQGAPKEIEVEDVPAKVLEAVKSKAPRGEILSVMVEEEDGDLEFEFEIKIGDETIEIEVELSADGGIEVEVGDDDDDADDDD
jgi:hypothetical protein